MDGATDKRSTGLRVQVLLNRLYARQFRTIMLFLVGYYLIVSLSHLLFTGADHGPFLSVIALSAVAVSLFLYFFPREDRFRRRYSNSLILIPAMLALANVSLHLFLSGDHGNFNYFVLTLVAAALVTYSRNVFYLILSIGAGLYISALIYVPGPFTQSYSFMLVFAVPLAVLAFEQKRSALLCSLRREVRLRSNALELDRRRRRQEELAEAASAANQMKSDYLANTSHEIKTPLTGIIGAMDILRNTPLNREQERLINTAYQSGKGLLRILDDILDSAKLESGELEILDEAFAPSEVVMVATALREAEARKKGLNLSCHIKPGDEKTLLVGDGVRIGQVVQNLIGNAIKFTDIGAVTVMMYLEGRGDRRTLTISVQDTGCGLTQDELAQVFRRFKQVRNASGRRYRGAGLGLAISQELAVGMGGTLSVASEKGDGSIFTFTVDLPVVEFAKIEAKGGHIRLFTSSDRPLKVLVADDSMVNRALIKGLLKHQNIELEMVTDGLQAFEKIKDSPDLPDMVLMDIQMPVMGGVEAVQAIRALEDTDRATIPIIALTASVQEGDTDRYREAGMDATVAKPIDREFLLTTIETVWGGAEARG